MSDRKLVYKVTIDEITPIENSDNLELARTTGWRVVVQKGEFKPGDTALYFEIDSALSPHDDRFSFLKERCYKKFNVAGRLFDECLRIRTIKLRGQLSQGLLLPVGQFCEVRNKALGEDCSDVLMVRHYDEVAEKAVREQTPFLAANQKGLFPSFVPKTDEERIQNVEDHVLEQFADLDLEVTMKVDGSSMTVAYSPSNRPDDPVYVCSRNFELKDMPSAWWDVAHDIGICEKLRSYCDKLGVELAIQGELNGPGIQHNRDNKEALGLQVFRIWNIKEARWLTPEERYQVCRDLELEHVPVLGVRKISDFKTGEGWQGVRDTLLKFAEGKTPNGNEREGVVFKAMNGNGFSFKAVSNVYLLGLK